MKITKRQLGLIVKKLVIEASARSKDNARNWKQGDDLDLSYDDDYIPDEIQDFMSDDEKEEFLGNEPTQNPGVYTLDDIVDTKILQTKSPAGTKGFIDTTLETLKKFLSDEEFMDEMINIKESSSTFSDFESVRDSALEIWIPSATKILGQDANQLPELKDNSFMNGFLFDFWFTAAYIKPAMRQVRKGKDNAEMFRSVADRWKYMSDQNKIQDFIKNVLTPAFTFLTRDTSVAG